MTIPPVDTRVLQILDKLEEIGSPILTSKGVPFEWSEHAFLLQPLCDFHPQQGWNKCSQIGGTEAVLLKAFYMAQHLKLNVLYTFPTDEFIKDVVPSKVNKLIENNQHIYSQITGGMYQKQVGTGKDARTIFFKGAYNPKSRGDREETSKGTSLTSDINIHDEASKSDQFILSQMRSRLDNSLYKGRWLLDNPTYPKMGADGYFQRSDQMYYFITCSHCRHKQYLDWIRLDRHEHKKALHTYIDPDKKLIICGKCAKSISDTDRMHGQWVPKYKSRSEVRGYWMNQLMYVRHSVSSLLEIQEDTKTPTSYFQNFVMGRPYIGSDVKITREHISQNLSMDVNLLEDNVMGVDQGRVKWYVIGNKQGIFAIGKTEKWSEIERLMKMYNATVVCDGLPEQQKPKEFADKYKGRFWRAFYKPTSDQTELAKFIAKKKYSVLIQRNESFDELVDKVVTGQFPIHMNINDISEYVEHMTNLVRVVKEDSEGNQRFEWVRTDADHLAHATLYFYTALNRGTIGAEKMSMKKKQNNDKLFLDSKGGNISADILDTLKKRK